MRHTSSVAVKVVRHGRPWYRFADGTVVPHISGGADDVPVEPAAEDLTALPEDELRTRFEALTAEYAERRADATRDQLDELAALQGRQQAIAAELERRRAEDAETRRALEALDAQAVTLPGPEDDDDDGGDDQAEAPETKAEPVKVKVAAAPAVSAAQVAAAATPPTSGERPQPSGSPAQRLHLVASASQQDVTAGSELSREDVGRLFGKALKSRAAGMHGVHEQILATVPPADFGDDALSQRNSTQTNDALIADTLESRRASRAGEPAARTAAICGPYDIIREIPGGQDTDERLSGIFPSRGAGRLGYTYTPAATLASVDGAVVEWSEAEQDLVDEDDPGTWKPCIDIDCPATVDVVMTETVGCVRVREDVQLSAPEKVDEVFRLVRTAAARHKVGQILSTLKAGSLRYDTDATPLWGSYVTLAHTVMSALARAHYDERLSEAGQPYTLIVGPGVAEQITLDRLARGFNPSDCESVQDAWDCLRRATGVDAVVDLNDVVAGDPNPWGAALPTTAGDKGLMFNLPMLFEIALVPTESWLYSTTGEAETGLQSDPQLVRQNRKQWFFREWWSLAEVGPAPTFWFSVTLCANGARGALVDPPTCNSATMAS